ncbi:MAG: EamA family transporter [Elusimicrobia bacterium]|nr:EamA family transporter [Elusimicrobiota bacterium]
MSVRVELRSTLAFALVYFFWGSTYLGIRIAVEHIPPGLMCAVRFLIAGLSMLGWCAASGKRLRYGGEQLLRLAVIGLLLLMGGNLTLSYAERVVPSGYASLIVASTPLWFVVLDSLLLGHRVTGRALLGLGSGIAGIAVLLWPKLAAADVLEARQLWWSLGLLGGSFSWALGSILSKRWQAARGDLLGAAAWQVFFAGLGNLAFALLFEDVGRAVWTARGAGAVLYLVAGGSWIGYTAYIWLLKHVPSSKVSTYAFVNPVVAVFLGWLFAHERVDGYILAGSAIVVGSVILVTTAEEPPSVLEP